MKITKRVEHRKLELEELVLQKECAPYTGIRKIGKGLNFLLIFGGSPKVLYDKVLENSWSHEEIEDFIKKENLYELKEQVSERYIRESGTVIDYLTVASHLISNFFKSYPGLQERIKRNRKRA